MIPSQSEVFKVIVNLKVWKCSIPLLYFRGKFMPVQTVWYMAEKSLRTTGEVRVRVRAYLITATCVVDYRYRCSTDTCTGVVYVPYVLSSMPADISIYEFQMAWSECMNSS